MAKQPKFDASVELLSDIHAALGSLLRDHYHLQAEVEDLREYKQKYSELLDSSMSHGRDMMRGMLDLCLTPGVMPAIAKANSSTVKENAK